MKRAVKKTVSPAATKDDLNDMRDQILDAMSGKFIATERNILDAVDQKLLKQEQSLLSKMDKKLADQKEAIVKDVGDYVADTLVPLFDKHDKRITALEHQFA